MVLLMLNILWGQKYTKNALVPQRNNLTSLFFFVEYLKSTRLNNVDEPNERIKNKIKAITPKMCVNLNISFQMLKNACLDLLF